MAKLEYSNQISYTGVGYLDANIMPVNTYAELMNFPLTKRFVGLEIVVLHDEKNSGGEQARYWLKGGIENCNWEKKSEKLQDSTISGESNTLKITVKEKEGVLTDLDIDATGLATKTDLETTKKEINDYVDSGFTTVNEKIDTKQNILTPGTNIVISGDTISADEGNIKSSFTTYTQVGFLEPKTTITSGTTIESLLRQILTKRLDVTAVLPKTSITKVSGNEGGNYEIGSSISIILGHTYTDGYFKAEENWGPDQSANCQETGTTFYRGATKLDENTDTQTIKSGTISYTCKTNYTKNGNTPKDNYGDDSTVTIAASSVTGGTISFNGYYKAYYVKNTTTKLDEDSDFATCVNVCSSNSLMNKSITVLDGKGEAIGTSTVTKYVYVLIPTSKTTPTFENELGVKGTMVVINDNLTNGYNTKYKLCTTKTGGHAGDTYKNLIISTN